VLWASGILGTSDESVGVRVFGIDPLSVISKPYRDGIVAGEFLAPDDRGGLLIGRKLAKSLGLAAGQQVSLLVNTSDEQPDEAIFTIRGLYDTGIPVYDETTLFLPLAKAQAFTRAGDQASAILILLNRQEDADRVAPTLSAAGVEVLTWRDLNQVLLQAVEMSNGMLYMIYMVAPGQVVLEVADVQHLQIETTDLSEKDVSRVMAGSPVNVYVEALGKQIKGSVSSIAPRATKVGGDVVYQVKVELDEQPQGLRWGMSVDVEISQQ